MTDDRRKSIVSLTPVYVRFRNRSDRAVNLFWIDYDGKPVKYATVPPRRFFDADTYETHPWTARDSRTSEVFLIERSETFVGRRRLRDGRPVRVGCDVGPPLRTLRTCCMLAVSDALRPGRVGDLAAELPATVFEELRAFCEPPDCDAG